MILRPSRSGTIPNSELLLLADDSVAPLAVLLRFSAVSLPILSEEVKLELA